MSNCRCGVSVDVPVMPGVTVPLPAVPGVCAPVPCGPPGVDGYSPTATVERNTEGALITITDKAGTTQAQIYDGDVSREEWLYAFPTDTASGAVAFFPDGADGLPVAELTVGIVPVQNFNGYANPWPPGGGKNLLENTGPETVTGSGVTFTRRSDEGISVSGMATRNAYYKISGGYGSDQVSLPPWLAVGSKYTASGTSGGCKVVVYFYDSDGATITTSTSTFTVPANAVYYGVFVLVESTGTAVNATVYPQIERGETATAFAPYSNVCPISGRTGLTLTRVGANLLPSSIVGTQGGVTATIADDGAISLRGTATATTTINGDFSAWQWDGVTPVWLSGCPSGGDYTNTYALRLSANQNTFSRPDTGNGVALSSNFSERPIVNVPLRFTIIIRAGVNADGLVFRPMLNVGTSASAFAPYSGENVTVSWESEAGTVYAGTLEVTSGVLTARPYYAAYAGEALVGPWVSSLDVYAPGAVPTTGAQVVDLGGAETVYQLTAQEVNTLLGANSIWSDAGDTAVTYRADPTLYINGKLAALQALTLENGG